MADFDIVALGEPLVELNQTHQDQQQYLQGFGGDTSNAVIAAARQGARCAYLTRVGDDAFGAQFLALWREEGVDISGVEIDATAHTGLYFVQHGPDGHAFSYLRRGCLLYTSCSRALRISIAMLSWRRLRITDCSGVPSPAP